MVLRGQPEPALEPAPSAEEGTLASNSGQLLVAGDQPEPEPEVREGGCSVPIPEPRCRRLNATPVQASSNAVEASSALDGSSCTVWNAGDFAPQSLELDLGEPAFVDGFELVPEMAPNGVVVHVIEVSMDGKRWEPAHRVEGAMESGVAFEMLLPVAMRARFLKVSTLASPSWVAWREIVVLHCAGGS